MGAPLYASDVAAAIRATLAGARTKMSLANWAFQAQHDEDTGRKSFDPLRWDEIKDAIYDLMFMEEGPEFDISDADLQTMAERLEQLGRPDTG